MNPSASVHPPPIRMTVIASRARIAYHVLTVDAQGHRQRVRVPVRGNREIPEWAHVHDRGATPCPQHNQTSVRRVMTVADGLQRGANFPFGIGAVSAQLTKP